MYIPEYLYHYTTMETAKLILENKTIRFNNLNKTDDIDESKTADVGIAGKYIFVSCWTDTPEENISLWSMYSNNFTGVRIRMKYNPFKNMLESKSVDLTRDSERIGINSINSKSFENAFIQIIPDEYLLNGKYTCVTPIIDKDKSYDKCIVRYSNNERLLYPRIYHQQGTKVSYDLSKVGIYKKRVWEYQREVRYRIYAVPIKVFDFLKKEISFNETILEALDLMLRNEELPISYIDLLIDEEAYKNMEITMGPKMKSEDKVKFIEFVNQKNPDCILNNSTINMRKHV